MNHHAVANVNANMGCTAGIIGSLEENQISGTCIGTGNTGTDIQKSLCAKSANIPSGMIDDP